jgi:hypothetical protein
VLNNAQADAHPGGIAFELGAEALERFEDPLPVLNRNARPLVLNPEPDGRVSSRVDRVVGVVGVGDGWFGGDGGRSRVEAGFATDRNDAAGRGMFDGVVDEVDKGLLEGAAVDEQLGLVGFQRALYERGYLTAVAADVSRR